MKKNFSEFEIIPTPRTKIGADVWIGANAIILSGVTVGVGAVVGAGSCVTKDVGPYEVWAGNPAHKIRDRFQPEIIEQLLKLEWWNWEDDRISQFASMFDDPQKLIDAQDKVSIKKI